MGVTWISCASWYTKIQKRHPTDLSRPFFLALSSYYHQPSPPPLSPVSPQSQSSKPRATASCAGQVNIRAVQILVANFSYLYLSMVASCLWVKLAPCLPPCSLMLLISLTSTVGGQRREVGLAHFGGTRIDVLCVAIRLGIDCRIAWHFWLLLECLVLQKNISFI